MKLLYFGPMWPGSTARQRAEALGSIDGLETLAVDTGNVPHSRLPPIARLRWKLGIPADRLGENERLLAAAHRFRPDAAVIDSSRVLSLATLATLRALGCRCLAFYSPDDAVAPHSLSRHLVRAFGEWDLFFTTKSFNLAELRARGVRRPVLLGNSFDPALHRPLTPAEAGPGFERYDAVFVGVWEKARCDSLNHLAEAGVSVAVYGRQSRWAGRRLAPRIDLRDVAYGEHYVRALHSGRIALGFLRRKSRDLITTRSVEIPACGRPMLAERSCEHDAAFTSGVEYESFRDDDELVARARALLGDEDRRLRLAAAGLARCRRSDYSTLGRAREMAGAIALALSGQAMIAPSVAALRQLAPSQTASVLPDGPSPT